MRLILYLPENSFNKHFQRLESNEVADLLNLPCVFSEGVLSVLNALNHHKQITINPVL